MLARPPRDRSLEQLGLWRTGFFTVPDTTPADKIEFHWDSYRRKYGAALEAEGFDVLYMGNPFQNHLSVHPVDADRRRYEIQAWVRRRPKEVHILVPDNAVPQIQRLGLTLKE